MQIMIRDDLSNPAVVVEIPNPVIVAMYTPRQIGHFGMIMRMIAGTRRAVQPAPLLQAEAGEAPFTSAAWFSRQQVFFMIFPPHGNRWTNFLLHGICHNYPPFLLRYIDHDALPSLTNFHWVRFRPAL